MPGKGPRAPDHLLDVDGTCSLSRAELEVRAKALRTVNAITDAVFSTNDPAEVFRRAVDAIARFTRFPAIAIFELNEAEQRLDLLYGVGFSERTLRAGAHLPLWGSLTGIAIRRHEVVLSSDVSHDDRTEPTVRERLAEDGFAALASVPLIVGDRVLGALNLIYKGELGLSSGERDMLASFGKVIALGVDRAHHVEHIERERLRARRSEERCTRVLHTERREQAWRIFMHEAGGALASSLEYEVTLAQVARLAAAASLAEWCVVDVRQPDGSIRRLAGAHADPAKQPLVDNLLAVSRLDPAASDGVPLAIRTGQAVVHDHIGDDDLRPGPGVVVGTRDTEHIRALHALELQSYMSVPLVAGGKTLGAVSLVSSDPEGFEPSEVEHAQELGQRCAAAVESARLYREARDAIAVRDEFLNVASHELRTPLTALQLDLETLDRSYGARSDPAVATKLARARQQARRLANLCEGLLDVSRLSSMGNLVLDVERVDVREIVTSVVSSVRAEADRARCSVALDDGPPVSGCWDRARLQRVISILLANAIKYGAGYPVEIAVKESEGRALLTVTDHGIGIAPEDAARIFERFERAAPSQHYGGLGLGLYIAREIVHAHGGSILVSSEPGAGATFTVVLPMTTAASCT